MDITPVYFAACGAAGAVTYAFPMMVKALSRTPPEKFAYMNFGFSVFVGSVCAAIFTTIIGFHFPWTTEPEPWPLAMVIGLGSNPLVPILLKKLEKWAGAFEGLKK
jgi:drug/metabolite transporter (DMT)-like permease